MGLIAGIDGGSISIKIALMDSRGAVIRTVYERHHGKPLECANRLLQELAAEQPDVRVAFTGSSGKLPAGIMEAPHINELSAFARATSILIPEAGTIFEMGGEDSKLIILEEDGSIRDFSLNSVCAAGTGSFLDQQAERMRLTIEEFAELALKSEKPPHIAGRCSVFAKSDMIHLQQIATPLHDIVAGLCFSVARNFKGSIVRGRPLKPKVAFMGGVAMNQGLVRAFREVFELDELIVPEHVRHMGAIGAAMRAIAEDTAVPLRLEELKKAARRDRFENQGRRPLRSSGDGFDNRHLAGYGEERYSREPTTEPINAFMGIDVGSISTNLAVVDEEGKLLSKRYLRTASRPIEAVRRGLDQIGPELAGNFPGVRILGVGTTGSGRYMVADFTGADIVKNEITAQARAAAFIDPAVDTIFEIGGQDSKYILLDNGVITDFEMNKACAAGTGSFLEEQAEKLGVAIKEEFASRALGAEVPCRLGERCTVFMENSLMSGLEQGAEMDDLLAGLAYSIVENYIGRVVAGKPVGKRIFFQGGTAFNKSVTAAFEKYLDLEITVPPNHDVTGAIGMALIARDHMRATGGETTFRGFDLAHLPYEQSSFECKGCENRCEINKVVIEGSKHPLFYGGRCEKYDISRKKNQGIEDLFAFRENALRAGHEANKQAFEKAGAPAPRGRIGIPNVFFFHDYLPYFSTLLWELGFEPVLSGRTSRSIISLGVEAVLADTCFPIKAAQGHVKSLLDRGIGTIFMPSFINLSTPEDAYATSLGCPLTQSFPYQSRVANPEADILAPVVDLCLGVKPLQKELAKVLAPLGVGNAALKRAMGKAADAQKLFHDTLQEKGRQILAGLEKENKRALVIIGRPYNAFDPGMNLDIPKKLATLGEQAIPMDFLPPAHVHDDWPEMYWRSGQRMLRAVKAVKANPRLHPLVIGNFSCGPDSFILKFFDAELAGEPCLHLEIDEHSADAGAITRCEAFLDSLDGIATRGAPIEARDTWRPATPGYIRRQGGASGKKIFLPRMSDHAFGLAAAFRACGVDAEVMDKTDHEAINLARKYVSGKECYPCAVTTGDMLKTALSPSFEPGRSAFFMPGGNGPCRFGQYNVFQRMVLDKAGFADVSLFSPMQNERLYQEVGIVGTRFSKLCWDGVIAFDLLTKCLHETRPLEATPGESDALYDKYMDALITSLSAGNGNMEEVLRGMRADFESVSRTDEKKPLIGIVGEIFVRSNTFSNEDLVKKIEALGGRAWLAPIDEWIYYVGAVSRRKAVRHRELGTLAKLALKHYVQTRTAHRFESLFTGFLATAHEPGTEQVLRKASPYLHASFEGEAVLSVGKAVDMCQSGVAGIVNAMPFGCMPGTISAAMLRAVSKEFDVPTISIPYDGTASPTTRLTLETFMEQAAARAGN